MTPAQILEHAAGLEWVHDDPPAWIGWATWAWYLVVAPAVLFLVGRRWRRPGRRSSASGDPWTWPARVASWAGVIVLGVAVVVCGTRISGNAGITFYHGNGPSARGRLVQFPGLNTGNYPVRIACRRHAGGHVVSSQMIGSALVRAIHGAPGHVDSLGRGYPFCCFPPSERTLPGAPRGRPIWADWPGYGPPDAWTPWPPPRPPDWRSRE